MNPTCHLVSATYLADNIRCNSISPARVHAPFVDEYLRRHYPSREQEMFDKLSHTRPIGRMAEPHEVGARALFLGSDEAAFITGGDYAIDRGFLNLRGWDCRRACLLISPAPHAY
jgi:2-keto-3-deoxy-L-fuconate dehydrogenase